MSTFILFVGLFLGSVVLTTCERSQLCWKKNGDSYYVDNDKLMCCGEHVEQRDADKDCCEGASSFYYKSTKLCCDDALHERHVGGINYECCNDTIISLDTQMCCKNVIHKKPKGDAVMQCCGADLVNTTTTMCCINDNKPLLQVQHARLRNMECCGHKPIDVSQENCLWDDQGQPVPVPIGMDYCEGAIINKRHKTCCHNKIYNQPYLNPKNLRERNPRSECCGTTGYDPTTHRCCPSSDPRGLVIPNDEHLQCCKGATNGYVNSNLQLCCDGQAWNIRSSNDVCCGHQLIDSREQACCDGLPYDHDTHKCCRGVPSGVLPLEKKCCGGSELKPGSLCCDGVTPVKKSDPSHDACCRDPDTDKYVTFNSTEKACDSGYVTTLMTRRGPDDRSCAGNRYQTNKAVCCDLEIHWFKGEGAKGCCRKWDMSESVFSLERQLCCEGTVYSKNDPTNPCRPCGEVFYDPSISVCCGRQVYKKSSDGDHCCGNKPFFTETQTCCDGEVHGYKVNGSNAQCCGKETYDPRYQKCCGGYQLMPKKHKTLRCCNHFMAYNRRYGKCRSNGFVERKKEVSLYANVCKRRSCSDTSGLEVEICARSLAIRCKVSKKKFNKESSSYKLVLRQCNDLSRPYAGDNFNQFVATHNRSSVEITIPSERKKCQLKKRQWILIFLDQQPVLVNKRKRRYKLTIPESGAFRIVADSRDVKNLIDRSSKESYCIRLLDRMDDEDLKNYFKNEIW